MSVASILLVMSVMGQTMAIAGARKTEATFVGRVVGFDAQASLMNLTSAPQNQILIIHVAGKKKGSPPRFLKVVVTRLHGEPELRPQLFEAGRRFRFTAWTSAEVRAVCQSSIPQVKWLDPNAKDLIQSTETLQCLQSRPEKVVEVLK